MTNTDIANLALSKVGGAGESETDKAFNQSQFNNYAKQVDSYLGGRENNLQVLRTYSAE